MTIAIVLLIVGKYCLLVVESNINIQ